MPKFAPKAGVFEQPDNDNKDKGNADKSLQQPEGRGEEFLLPFGEFGGHDGMGE